jgi:hypothetical protein
VAKVVDCRMADLTSRGSLELRWSPGAFCPTAMRLDLFGLLLIQFRQVVTSLSFGPQQLIELCVNSLCIPVFGALNEKRHNPGRERGNAVPIERSRAEEQPGYDVGAHDGESQRARR